MWQTLRVIIGYIFPCRARYIFNRHVESCMLEITENAVQRDDSKEKAADNLKITLLNESKTIFVRKFPPKMTMHKFKSASWFVSNCICNIIKCYVSVMIWDEY